MSGAIIGGTRVRHALKRRVVQVRSVEDISPGMRRIVVAGAALDGFVSLGADDHVKLFFPPHGLDRGTPPSEESVFSGPRRDYTPRRYDAASTALTLEFVLHGHGPAASWAAGVTVGDWLGVGGPRGSLVLPETDEATLLIGDETALPAIARRLEEMRPGLTCLVLIEAGSRDEIRPLPSAASVDAHWVSRDGAIPGTTTLLDDALAALKLPSWPLRVWIGAEIETARRLRTFLIEQRGLDRAAIKAAGYWRIGEADSHGTIEE